MLITELFTSVQGEGVRVGTPAAFVRLNRCNLRCSWCDSEYTFTRGVPMTVAQVAEAVRGFGPLPNVCITGDEPLIQRHEPRALIDALLTLPWLRSIEVETGGPLPIWVAHDPRLFWDLDVKRPGSSMDRLASDNLAGWLLGEPVPGARPSLQTHRFIWPPDMRGV